MSGLNKVMIIGHLGRDPEVTYTQAGMAVAKIAVATSDKWKDKSTGETREKTEWHRITFFGKQAETIGRYMSKGSQIYVEGRLQTTQYEKDGITRYSTDIIANNFQFIGNRGNGNFQQQGQQGGYQQPHQQGGFQQPPADFRQTPDYGKGGFQQGPPDDDIPF